VAISARASNSPRRFSVPVSPTQVVMPGDAPVPSSCASALAPLELAALDEQAGVTPTFSGAHAVGD
jgi:hypothetical protein